MNIFGRSLVVIGELRWLYMTIFIILTIGGLIRIVFVTNDTISNIDLER